jgi:hypothetical protein
MSSLDQEPRPALPWPYVVILLAEILALGSKVAMAHGAPPMTYEAGWVAVGSMLITPLYSLRRRVRLLRGLGSLAAWLDVHVFLGLQAFILVAYHSIGLTAHVTLSAINFALTGVIVVSGLFGRFVYALIPRARAEDAHAYCELSETVLRGMTPPSALRRECRGFVDMVGLDLMRRRTLRQLLRDPEITPLHARAARRSILLASRISALELAERWLSHWILLHRPLAILLLGVTTLHVLAHFAYAL